MNTRTRAFALFLALLLAAVTAFSVFAEGGDGSGGGENHDKPLVLDHCNITNGQDNVDPNVRIELYFTKNVVNIVVRDENKKCFTVTDSSGSRVPITVEMGDDQIEPTDAVKRTVTVVPAAPYKPCETYVLKVSKGLAAKNGRDVLEKDVYISFTIAGETTSTYKLSPAGPAAATTTTTKPAETTTNAPRTTKPVIVAATGTSAAITESVSQSTTRTAESTTKRIVTTTAAHASAVTQTVVTNANTTTTANDETLSETVKQTEAFSFEETTGAYIEEKTIQQTEAAAEPETELTPEGTETRASSALLIGILIALAAAAGTVIGIFVIKKKKG